jgi:hypothetical protein
MERDELKTVTGAVGLAEATIGNPVPVDKVRFIYRIRWISNSGSELLLIGSRENGAGATTNIDTLDAEVPGPQTDPDGLHEDSAPLYSIHGGPSRGSTAANPPATSLVRFQTTVGAGIVTYWYTDEEA